MDTQAIFPGADPLPLPGPPWLLQVLLSVTFFLHLLAMNGLAGGIVLSLAARIGGRRNPALASLSGRIAKGLPSWMAATISLGVAPLLFVQALYGQALYTSSVLMAWPWLLLLSLLVIAYYALYLAAFRIKGDASGAGSFIALAGILVVVITFLLTSNLTLMLTPERWAAIYEADPSGWNLNLTEPTLIPRLLHFLLASVAVAGLFCAGSAIRWWSTNPEEARHALRFGGKAFLWPTMIQFGVGIWFLLALPREQMLRFMGKDMPSTIFMTVGFVLSAALIIAVARTLKREDPRPGFRKILPSGLALVFLMLLMRDRMREGYLQPWLDTGEASWTFQASPALLFVVLFAGGVALWIAMMRRFAEK